MPNFTSDWNRTLTKEIRPTTAIPDNYTEATKITNWQCVGRNLFNSVETCNF